MNEQQDKERVKQAIDNTLQGMTGDPFLSQRVMAKAEKGEAKMKYAILKGLVIVLIVILCMGTVALAARVYGGAMGWTGELISEEEADTIAGCITAELSPEQERMSMKLNDLAELYRTDGEMLEITVREGGRLTGGISVEIRRSADTMDAFMTMLEKEENLPIPVFVPEGYKFVRGVVIYDCRAGGTWQLIERMELEDGITVERHFLAENDMLARKYSLLFRNTSETDAYLWVAADLMPQGSSDKQYVKFSESQMPRVIAVPGMDNALAVTAEENGYIYLTMRRALAEPVGYRGFHAGEGNLDELVVYIDAQGIELDSLIRMFTAE